MLGPGYDGPPPPGRVLEDGALWPRALAGAELVVCGFGHTLLEAAHLGVPAVAIPRHDARRPRGRGVLRSRRRWRWRAPTTRSPPSSALRGSDRLREMRRTGPALVDGHGAERVAAALEALR